jgi:hypothetical protein
MRYISHIPRVVVGKFDVVSAVLVCLDVEVDGVMMVVVVWLVTVAVGGTAVVVSGNVVVIGDAAPVVVLGGAPVVVLFGAYVLGGELISLVDVCEIVVVGVTPEIKGYFRL